MYTHDPDGLAVVSEKFLLLFGHILPENRPEVNNALERKTRIYDFDRANIPEASEDEILKNNLPDNAYISSSIGSGSMRMPLRNADCRPECVQILEGDQSYVICIIKFREDLLISCSNDKNIKILKQE